jgi:hypothetical protein
MTKIPAASRESTGNPWARTVVTRDAIGRGDHVPSLTTQPGVAPLVAALIHPLGAVFALPAVVIAVDLSIG